MNRRCKQAHPSGLGLVAGLTLCCLAATLTGCSESPVQGPDSVLLITLDTTRADALGCYGSSKGVTPNLDALARESVVYDEAFTVAPITLPAHASMLTGLYPPRHSIRDNGLWPLPESAETLAELARRAQIQTAAMVASIVLDDTFGLDQGFETYVGSRVAQTSLVYASRPAWQMVDEALAWLERRDPERPFLLWLHLYDPHAPYDPPVEHRHGFEGSDLYYGELSAVDSSLGRLFERMREQGLLDSTLLAVTSDHGEAFGEHGEYTHGPYCYDSTLRVPLLLRYPDGYRAGERDGSLVSVVDLFPTLLEALRIEVPSGKDGASLYRRVPPADRGVYFESFMGYIAYGWSPLAGWLDARGKYLHSSSPQFFDWKADPEESRNLLLAPEREAADLDPYRRRIAAVADAPSLEPRPTDGVDEELIAQLRSLGYAAMGGSPPTVPHPLAPTDRPSPADSVEEYTSMLQVIGLIDARRSSEAVEILEKVVRQSPQNYFALEQLAGALVRMNLMEKALPHLERLVRDGPQRSTNYQNLASCFSGLGRTQEAIDALHRALALDPKNAGAIEGLIKLLQREGRGLEAEPLRERLRALKR